MMVLAVPSRSNAASGSATVATSPPLTRRLNCTFSACLRVISRVTDQRADFLRLIESHGLVPGRGVVVSARDELMETVEVIPERGEPLRLGFRAASRVWVSGGRA